MSGIRGNHRESIQSSGKTQLADFGDLIEKGSSSQMGKGFFGKYFSSSFCRICDFSSDCNLYSGSFISDHLE